MIFDFYVIFSPIRVVRSDQAGSVWDGEGLTVEEDKDYRPGYYSVSLHFTGFESELNGISHYMWALGTQPRSDDVKALFQLWHLDHRY